MTKGMRTAAHVVFGATARCGAFGVGHAALFFAPRAADCRCGIFGASSYQGRHHTTTSLDTRRVTNQPVLTFVTGNKSKLAEVQQILGKDGGLPFEISNQKVDLPELQGDVIEIAKNKCRQAALTVKGPCFTEDTSLCFNALNGLPGPYIKWFLESCGHDGLNKMLVGFDDQSAYAQTVVAYTDGSLPDDEIHIFDGRTHGKIVAPRGPLDFGWDPMFEPNEGMGKTYAEMSMDEKNAISHRGRAFAKFRSFLMHHAEDIAKR